jgi:hypothetical protein
MTPRQPHGAPPSLLRSGILSAQQWLLCGVIRRGAYTGDLSLAARVEEVVVETLRYEDEVGDAKVDCEGSDSGHEPREEGAGKIVYVTDEPDAEEEQTDAICGTLFVVFYELGDLHNSPAVRWVNGGEA